MDNRKAQDVALVRRIETFVADLYRSVQKSGLDSDVKSGLARHLRGAECAAAVGRQRLEQSGT